MKILLINRNTSLLVQLSQVLLAAGHQVTLAISVNEAHENLGMSFLQPGEDCYSSRGFDYFDLIVCPHYDVHTYCGHERNLRQILNGAADCSRAACGIASSKADIEAMSSHGFTSFVSLAALEALTVSDVDALLARLVTEAARSVDNYSNRDEVVRRRDFQAQQRRMNEARNKLLTAAYSVPQLMQTPEQRTLIAEDQDDRRASHRACY
ncbi:MAG: hypothetical protein WC028_12035 [Candidatus Obscuribacterales bacterium]|jgi:hypothetical protein